MGRRRKVRDSSCAPGDDPGRDVAVGRSGPQGVATCRRPSAEPPNAGEGKAERPASRRYSNIILQGSGRWARVS
jgi:hypothetical protein